MRILIVDDEALARLRLRSLIDGLADGLADRPEHAVSEAADASAAMAQLRAAAADAPFDLLLLDIRMPGQSPNMGLRLAAALKAMPRAPAVVFVSAHAEHALTAFELDAVDYLTKPVRRERLSAALQRVRQRLDERGILARGATATATATATAIATAALDAPALVVSERGRVLRLPLIEVLYLRAELKYVTLRTLAHSYVLDDSLSELEQRLAQLGGPPFIRVHRNALVARHAVRALALRGLPDDEDGAEGWAVQVAPLDEWLAVSRRQVAAVRAALSGSDEG